jgi:signal transduction histidine kinase
MVLMLLTSLSLVAVLVIFYYQSEKALYNEFERQTTQLSKAIQIGLEGVAGKDLSDASLQAYLNRLNPQGVREISVISRSDRIMASTNHESVGKWITERRKDLIFKAELGQPVTGEGPVYNVILPVVRNQETVGFVHLALNAEDFSVFLRVSAIRRILAALVVFGLGTIVAYLLAGRYTQPIEQVAAAAGEVAAGHLEQLLPDRRSDEIGDLSRSFNHLVERLREDRILRERLRTAEHLASIGQVARNIAHEIRNPLNFISLSIDHMRDSFRPSDPERGDKFAALVGNIKGEIQRISRFVESFLDEGRPFELHRNWLAPAPILDAVLDLAAARTATQGILVERNYADLPQLYLDPDLFRTCLVNIIGNACEVLSEGGLLSVTGEVEAGEVVLRIADNGPGLPSELAERVFEPFFTTKAGGLGLGLALTRRVVEEHGGRIDFSSTPGAGSTVRIRLPVAGKER